MCNHKRLWRVSWKSYYKARPIRHAESREGEKTEGHDWGWHDPRKPEGEGGLGTCTPAPLFLEREFTLARYDLYRGGLKATMSLIDPTACIALKLRRPLPVDSQCHLLVSR